LKFGTDRHPLGRDPLGHKENKNFSKRSLSTETKSFLDNWSKKSQYKKIITESHLSDDKTEG
jgi:abortive infection bacteriophage resistance protein